jgi:peptidoglycan hydrolase-like protein with peptidoglycan-binding domain
MPDSIFPVNLPDGYPAYLGYTDGFWPTIGDLEKLFPHARLVSLTVRGGKAVGCDVESGDLSPAQGCTWARDQIRAGADRPVIYASASVMRDSVVPGLSSLGVARSSVRLLSAHYGIGEHICGPLVKACGYPQADGTQWTDAFRGVGSSSIDMSLLLDSFFTTPVQDSTAEVDMAKATVIRLGSTGQAVRNWQGLLAAHGHNVAIDGQFGMATQQATEQFQIAVHLGVDGVVGVNTWSAALV